MSRGRKPDSTRHTSILVQILKEVTGKHTNAELSRQLNTDPTTVHGWSVEKSSPLASLELVAKIEEGTGLSAREILELLKNRELELIEIPEEAVS